jgi:hypothetical protein
MGWNCHAAWRRCKLPSWQLKNLNKVLSILSFLTLIFFYSFSNHFQCYKLKITTHVWTLLLYIPASKDSIDLLFEQIWLFYLKYWNMREFISPICRFYRARMCSSSLKELLRKCKYDIKLELFDVSSRLELFPVSNSLKPESISFLIAVFRSIIRQYIFLSNRQCR